MFLNQVDDDQNKLLLKIVFSNKNKKQRGFSKSK